MNTTEFCKLHDACTEGKEWAEHHSQDMSIIWRDAKPEWVVWIATRSGVLTDKDLRLFAVFCAKSALALATNPDPRSLRAVEVAEKFANGEATEEELSTARSAARSAAWSAAETAAWSAQKEWLLNHTNPTF